MHVSMTCGVFLSATELCVSLSSPSSSGGAGRRRAPSRGRAELLLRRIGRRQRGQGAARFGDAGAGGARFGGGEGRQLRGQGGERRKAHPGARRAFSGTGDGVQRPKSVGGYTGMAALDSAAAKLRQPRNGGAGRWRCSG